MNELKVFENPDFGSIRTVEVNSEPYFVGKDVAEILGYTDTYGALKKHVDNEDRQNCQNDSFETPRGMTVINESGLYSLILSSKLPTAKKFKRWVTSEVIPSIRKHGAYMTPEKLEEAILNPDTMIKLCTALKEEQSRNKALQAVNSQLTVENAIMKPKADYFDAFCDRSTLTNFRETALQIGVKEKAFTKYLIDHKYIYRDKKGKLMPYSQKNDGLFEVKEFNNERTGWHGTQTLITPKGRETFKQLF